MKEIYNFFNPLKLRTSILKFSVLLVFLLAFLLPYGVQAQNCNNVTVDAEGIDAICDNDGQIKVTLSGTGIMHYDSAMYRLSDVGGAPLTSWAKFNATGNGIKYITNLSRRTYRVECQVLCSSGGGWYSAGGYVLATVGGNYQTLNATATPVPTLNCTPTGELRFNFSGGRSSGASYTIEYSVNGGPFIFFKNYSTPRLDTIRNLPQGDYVLRVSDNCSNSFSTPNRTVEALPEDLNSNLVYQYPSRPHYSMACDSVETNGYYSVPAPIYEFYWDNVAFSKYYEFSYTMGPNETSLNPYRKWKPLEQYLRSTLPLGMNYKTICESSDNLYVIVRVKGCPTTQKTWLMYKTYICPTNMSFNSNSAIGTTCDSVKLSSSVSSTYCICYPATWSVIVDGTAVGSYPITDVIGGTVVGGGTLTYNNQGLSTTRQFARGKTYHIKIVDALGRVFYNAWTTHNPQEVSITRYLPAFGIPYESDVSINRPMGSRYIYLYASNETYLLAGSTITYVSGPQTLAMGPPGSSYTLPTNTNSNFYPNSPAPHTSVAYSIMQPGTYNFTITPPAPCTGSRSIGMTLPHYYKAPDTITFTKKEVCGGMRIYIDQLSKCKIRLDGPGSAYPKDTLTYYRIISGPTGVMFDLATNTDSLLLPAPGKYVIGACTGNLSTARPMYTMEVEVLSTELFYIDYGATSGYACAGGPYGNIVARVGKGLPPYNFTLKDATTQAVIATVNNNTTGSVTFQGGVSPLYNIVMNKHYTLTVSDKCQTLTYDILVLDLDNIRIAYAPNNGVFCVGDSIEVNSVALGNTSYSWSGPPWMGSFAGWTSANPRPRRLATLSPITAGRYIIAVIPQFCAITYRDTLNVTVLEHVDVPPLVKDVYISTCKSTSSPGTMVDIVALSGATPTGPDLELVWYNSNGVQIDPPTAVSTYINTAYTAGGSRTVYYVSQRRIGSFCDSERVQIVFTLTATTICEGTANINGVTTNISLCTGGKAKLRFTAGATQFGAVMWGGFAQGVADLSIPLVTSISTSGELSVRFTSDYVNNRPVGNINISCSGSSGGGGTIYTIPQSGVTSATTCSGTLKQAQQTGSDPSPGNYFDYSNGVIRLSPSTPGAKISVYGIAEVEANFDFFTIYNGGGCTTPGRWESNDESVAIVVNGDSVLAVGQGTTTFSYVACGAVYVTTNAVTVTSREAEISYPNNGTYCKNEGTQAVIRTGTAGGVYSALPAGLSINSSTGLITPATSTAGTYIVSYTVPAQGICPAFVDTAKVIIKEQSTASAHITATDASICTGGSVNLNNQVTAKGGLLNPVFRWYTTQTGNVLVSNPTNITVAGSYYVSVEGSNYCEGAPNSTGRATVVVVINSPSTAAANISKRDTAICSGNSVNLTTLASAIGVTNPVFRWYTTQTGSVLVSPTTVSPTVTTYYYVSVSGSNYCEGAANGTGRATVTVTVKTQSTAEHINKRDTTICSGASVNLNTLVSAPDVTNPVFRWYATATTPTQLSPTTGTLTATTTYYVSVSGDNFCEGPANTSGRKAVTVTVNNPPTAPTTITPTNGVTTICQGQSTWLKATGGATGTSSNYKWGTGSSCGSNTIAGIIDSILVAPTVTTTYWVRREGSGACTNITGCATVTINVKPRSTAAANIVAHDTAVCAATLNLNTLVTATPDITGTPVLIWYATLTGTTALTSSTVSLTLTPTSYYVAVSGDNLCEGEPSAIGRKMVTVVGNSQSTAAHINKRDTTICRGASVNLNTLVSAPDVTNPVFRWYATATATTQLSPTVTPTATTIYYVSVSGDNFCEGPANTSGRQTVTVTVNIPPTAPTTITATNGVTTVCHGVTTTLTASGGVSGTSSVYQWGTGSTCGLNLIPDSTGVTLKITPTTTTTYWVRRISTSACTDTTGCASATITVKPRSTAAANIVAHDTAVCATTLNLNTLVTETPGISPPVTLIWYATLTGTTALSSSTVSLTLTPTPYYVAVSGDNLCEGEPNAIGRKMVTVAMNSQSTADHIDKRDTTICRGDSANLNTLVSAPDVINPVFRWYATATTLTQLSSTIVSPTNTTTYYVSVSGTNFCEGASNSTGRKAVTVTVNIPPTAPTNIGATGGATTVCYGITTTLTASGGTEGTSSVYQWGTGSTCGSNIISGETGSTLTITPIETTTYWARRIGTGACTNITGCATATINVKPRSTAASNITVRDTAVCGTSLVNLNDLVTGTPGVSAPVTLIWYATLNGTTSLSSIIVTPSTTPTPYYVAVSGDNVCEGEANATGRKMVTVSMKQYATALQIMSRDTTLCNGDSVNLFTLVSTPEVTSPTVKWYTSATGSTLVTNPTAITLAGIYYAAVLGDNFCENASGSRKAVTVALRQPPTAPAYISASVHTTICQGQTITLTATGGTLGDSPTYQWGTGACGSNIISGQTSASITITPATTTTYWVRRLGSGQCSSVVTACIDTTVTVTQRSTASLHINKRDTAICMGSWLNLTELVTPKGDITGPFTFKWYTTLTGSTEIPNPENASYAPPTTTYYVSIIGSNYCEGTADAIGRVAVTATIKQPSTAIYHIVKRDTAICSGNSVNLNTLVEPSGDIIPPVEFRWYASATSMIPLTMPVSPAVTTEYWTSVEGLNYCEGAPNSSGRARVVVTVRQAPTAPISIEVTDNITTLCQGVSTTLTATGGTLGDAPTYRWGTGTCGSDTLPQTGSSITVAPNETTTYWVRRIGSVQCSTVATACATITINITPRSTAAAHIDKRDTTVCAGTQINLTHLVAAKGDITTPVTFKWYTTVDGTVEVTNITNATYNATTTYYVAIIGNNYCEGFNNATGRAAVTINVKQFATVTEHINKRDTAICIGSSVNLNDLVTKKGDIENPVFKWYTSATGSTNPTLPVSPTTTTTYYVSVEGSNYCEGLNNTTGRAPVIVTVNTLPTAPVVSNACNLAPYEGTALVTVKQPKGSIYQYTINDGDYPYQSDTIFAQIPNGTHAITVKNTTTGCIATSNFTIDCNCVAQPALSVITKDTLVCGANTITLSGNTFGGLVDRVDFSLINASGTLTATYATTSPFTIQFNPVTADLGKTIKIVVATDNPNGAPCVAKRDTVDILISRLPELLSPVTIPDICSKSTCLYGIECSLPTCNISWIRDAVPGIKPKTANGSTSTINETLTNTQNTPITVTYKVKLENTNGCAIFRDVTVIVTPNVEPTLKIKAN